ncbi:protein rolling stone-like [Mercenaria mercenaria]|uniref:protein rolling stone-like n=1 Tax=Mercenaria mercenaria TaxID=6596 RepID=UPI00234ED93A|nr:protein rolling stone-like [Mercenaria mercenaria]
MSSEQDITGDGHCYNFKKEFQLRKFGLNHEDPSLFVKPQCFPKIVYIPWTIIWALFYLMNLGFEVYYDIEEGPTYLTKVTNIAYILQSAFVFTDCFVTIYVHVRRTDIKSGETNVMPWYIRVQWLLFNASNSFSVLISLIYYGFLNVEFNHGSVYIHLLNSVYTFLGILFSAKPVQLLHVYQPMVPALLYMSFSIIYHILGGHMIYPILDWGNKTARTSLYAVVFICVAVPLIHLTCYLLHRIRVFLHRKCTTKKADISQQSESNKAYDSSAL